MNAQVALSERLRAAVSPVPVTSGTQPKPALAAILSPASTLPSR
jgi:hypothetical protein